MEKSTFFDFLQVGMKKLNFEVSNLQIDMFFCYMELLIEWNKKFNLTAILKPEEIIQKHFIDSATVLKYLDGVDSLIDVGTGAGFPGIPVKILKPELKVTLLDSLNKRVRFLDEVIKRLGLDCVKAVHFRAEEAARNKLYREKYDVVVSRAVANMSTLAEYNLPFVKVGGKAIFMKGSEIDDELNDAKNAIATLGGEVAYVDNFVLPDSDIIRNNVIVHKVRTTSGKFPRKPGLAKKEPIK